MGTPALAAIEQPGAGCAYCARKSFMFSRAQAGGVMRTSMPGQRSTKSPSVTTGVLSEDMFARRPGRSHRSRSRPGGLSVFHVLHGAALLAIRSGGAGRGRFTGGVLEEPMPTRSHDHAHGYSSGRHTAQEALARTNLERSERLSSAAGVDICSNEGPKKLPFLQGSWRLCSHVDAAERERGVVCAGGLAYCLHTWACAERSTFRPTPHAKKRRRIATIGQWVEQTWTELRSHNAQPPHRRPRGQRDTVSSTMIPSRSPDRERLSRLSLDARRRAPSFRSGAESLVAGYLAQALAAGGERIIGVEPAGLPCTPALEAGEAHLPGEGGPLRRRDGSGTGRSSSPSASPPSLSIPS